MKIFDTHAHYEDKMFDEDRYQVLDEIENSEVECIMNCCSDEGVFDMVIDLVEHYDFVYGSIGIHPHWVLEVSDGYLDKIQELAKHKKIVAIGEMGLDYFWKEPKDLQKKIFVEQLELAMELNKPVIIHDRDAHEDVLEILKRYKPQGILHRFGGPVQMLKEAFEWGMYVSFNNDLTYPEWNKPHIDCLMATPFDRLLIETDCPYAPPVEEREGRCDSRDCRRVVEEIARLRNVDAQFIAEIAYDNALRAYGLK